MKITSIVFLFILSVSSISTTIAQDKNDPNATILLGYAREKLENLKGYQFEFELIVHRNGENTPQTGSYIAANNKYIINTNGMRLLSDGNSTYTFKNNEQDIEIYDIDKESTEIDLLKGPASILSLYETGTFAYQIISTPSEPSDIIAFKPIDKDGGIVKIVLSLSKKNELESCQIFMRDASNYLLKINNFNDNPMLGYNMFVFDKGNYPNANIEDLRL